MDTEESAPISRKPLVQGRPDRFGGPVVTCSCAFFISHARLRVRSSTRLSLRPRFSGGTWSQTSDAWRRENARICLDRRIGAVGWVSVRIAHREMAGAYPPDPRRTTMVGY